jgi:4-amino-4-deoxy-L-arabinose transferase-like glycosyltransferase
MMPDMLLLALTAALSWGLWRLMETGGAMGACWLWGWGIWLCKELGYGQ